MQGHPSGAWCSWCCSIAPRSIFQGQTTHSPISGSVSGWELSAESLTAFSLSWRVARGLTAFLGSQHPRPTKVGIGKPGAFARGRTNLKAIRIPELLTRLVLALVLTLCSFICPILPPFLPHWCWLQERSPISFLPADLYLRVCFQRTNFRQLEIRVWAWEDSLFERQGFGDHLSIQGWWVRDYGQ